MRRFLRLALLALMGLGIASATRSVAGQSPGADDALRLMAGTTLPNGHEAVHILPLGLRALEVCKERKWFDRSLNFAEALLHKMPKEERPGHPSPSYVQMCSATADLAEAGGMTFQARKWREEANRLRAPKNP